MAKPKERSLQNQKPMSSKEKEIFLQGLLQEYDIQSAEDIQEALKDLLSGTLQDMLETEMDNHLGYDRYERSGEPNYRNGTKSKTVRSKYGEFEVDVPQDRQSSFEPQVLPKRQKDISAIDDKIIAMYAKGMTTRQISETIEDIYGFEVSEGMVSDITDKLLPKIEEWQNRPLSPVYPIVFIDAVHFSVRDDGVIRKLAAYVVLGINEDGMKEVLSIIVGENESSKYWLSVLNSLKNQWSSGYSHSLLRWINRNQGCNLYRIPKNRATALYCTYGEKYTEICCKQRYESLCKGFKDDLYSCKRRSCEKTVGDCDK